MPVQKNSAHITPLPYIILLSVVFTFILFLISLYFQNYQSQNLINKPKSFYLISPTPRPAPQSL